MIRCILFCLLWACLPFPATAAPLIADLSNYRIDIDSSFNGTRIFLFGARNDNGDIVVVVRGPHKDYIVRKKEEIGGIWVNRERMRFWNVPDFYAVAGDRPLAEIGGDNLRRQLGIGEETLLTLPADAMSRDSAIPFADAFLRHQHGRGLYRAPGSVSFMAETLFKTVIEFPDDIPPGNYTAEIYLISDGEVAGMQSTPITVVKSGLDEFLYNYAHDYPAWYGITAVLLALAAGWGASRIFEKA